MKTSAFVAAALLATGLDASPVSFFLCCSPFVTLWVAPDESIAFHKAN